MKKILILGFGNIAFRYLEGILNIEKKLNISIVDTDKSKFDKIRELKIGHHLVNSYVNYRNLKNNYDICIVSTTADVRRLVIKKLIKRNIEIKYWILEKLLVSDLNDLKNLKSILPPLNVYVNHPRRVMPFYKDFKDELRKYTKTNIILHYKAFNWNLLSNSIHFIDLVSWLFDTKVIKIESKNLNEEWFIHKNNKFYENFGQIKCYFENNIELVLTSLKKKINIDQSKYINANFKISFKNNAFLIKENSFKIYNKRKIIINSDFLLQSKISEITIKQLLDKGKCDLTLFDDSFLMHKIYLTSILKKWDTRNSNIKLMIT